MNSFFKILVIFFVLVEILLIFVTVLVAAPFATANIVEKEDPLTTAFLLVLTHVFIDAVMVCLLYYTAML